MLPLRPAQCIRRSRKRKPKSPSLKTRHHNQACVSYAMCTAPHENLNYIASSLVPVPQRRGNPPIPKQWNPCQNRFSELHPAMESATRLPSRSEQLRSERASKVSYSCSHGSHTLPCFTDMTKTYKNIASEFALWISIPHLAPDTTHHLFVPAFELVQDYLQYHSPRPRHLNLARMQNNHFLGKKNQLVIATMGLLWTLSHLVGTMQLPLQHLGPPGPRTSKNPFVNTG